MRSSHSSGIRVQDLHTIFNIKYAPSIVIYVSGKHKPDLNHIGLLDISKIEVRRLDYNRHTVGQYMKEIGELEKMWNECLI